ncbi:hypothetical protein BDW69DRAFT_153278 [Aspergillus filifer]
MMSGSNQRMYPSVFRASEERTQIRLNPRWWAEDASSLLWTWDIEGIKRLQRYELYDDPNLPIMAFSTRSEPDIDVFLATVLSRQEIQSIMQYPLRQKAQIFNERCQQIAPPRISWGWFPARKHESLEPRAIAEAIETESHLQFTRITYVELIRYALGGSSARIDWFLQQHTCLYAHLSNYLSAYPEEEERYMQVEERLRTQSPFAHRAVVQALRDAGRQVDLPNPRPGFDFFVVPIQRLFRELPQSLPHILMVIAVLEVRFEFQYSHTREMSWSRPFSVAHSFLEDFQTATSTSTSIEYLASTLSETDERDFIALIEGGTLDENVAIRLAARWERLVFEIWEFCKALPDQIPTILRCLENLLAGRNYHTLMALLSGLQRYSIFEAPSVLTDAGDVLLVPNQLVTAPEFLKLSNPSQNYAAYRERFQNSPGIPFLIPHLREQQEHGDSVFQHLYTQLREVLPLH